MPLPSKDLCLRAKKKTLKTRIGWSVVAVLVLVPGANSGNTACGSVGRERGAIKTLEKGAVLSRAKGVGTVTVQSRLSEEEGRHLLSEARRTIEGALFGKKGAAPSEKKGLSPVFHERRGTFVTLTKDGQLRGCIGHIIPRESMIDGVRTNAINAAFRDPRFPPVSGDEWGKIRIEVSILTDPRPLQYSDAQDLLDKLRPGVDGVIIKKGLHQATFLPQVWEQLPKKEEFLGHLCMKAGLDGSAWRRGDLEVSTYQVQAFEE